MKRVIVRVLFLHELSCSEVGLHDVEAGRNVAQAERCAFSRSLRCGYGFVFYCKNKDNQKGLTPREKCQP